MSEIKTHYTDIETHDDIKFINFNGSLDIFNVKDVIAYITPILQATQENTIILDMKKLEYINAQGISSLILLLNTIKNKRIFFMHVNNKIQELFQLLGFSNNYPFINDISELSSTYTNIFPFKIKCPSCNKELEIIKSGRIKCSSCQTVISINKKGEIEE